MAPTTNNSTWTVPRTWSTGELVTASLMNTHVRDNLNALHVPAGGYSLVNDGVDYTTTSTSFGDIDSTDMALTFTTGGGDVVIFAQMSLQFSTTLIAYFDIHESVANARAGLDDGLLACTGQSSVGFPVTLCYRFSSLTAASHTFKIQYKTSAGTLTVYAGAGTSTHDVHASIFGFEI